MYQTHFCGYLQTDYAGIACKCASANLWIGGADIFLLLVALSSLAPLFTLGVAWVLVKGFNVTTPAEKGQHSPYGRGSGTWGCHVDFDV